MNNTKNILELIIDLIELNTSLSKNNNNIIESSLYEESHSFGFSLNLNLNDHLVSKIEEVFNTDILGYYLYESNPTMYIEDKAIIVTKQVVIEELISSVPANDKIEFTLIKNILSALIIFKKEQDILSKKLFSLFSLIDKESLETEYFQLKSYVEVIEYFLFHIDNKIYSEHCDIFRYFVEETEFGDNPLEVQFKNNKYLIKDIDSFIEYLLSI
jgi:hypothetical protein